MDVGIVRPSTGARSRSFPPSQAFEGADVVLVGGRRLRPDSVVAATGFRPALEPLVGHLGVLDEEGRPLVHVADEHPEAPGLHFVGFTPSLGGALRRISWEAQVLARAVAAAEAAAPAAAAVTASSL